MEKEKILKYQEAVVKRVKQEKEKSQNSDIDNPEKINPIVVALLVDESGNEIWSHRSEMLDGDHAEYNLFTNKLNGEDHSKDTLFVSLEPCNCDSRLNTISCSELIVKAKIKTVYMGTFDPDILVKGNGYCYLKENHVDVYLFEEKYQKDLIDANWPFFEDKLMKDENYRRFNNKYNTILSDDAIAFYLYMLNDENEKSIGYDDNQIQKYKEQNKNYREIFYKTCLKKQYLYKDIEHGKRVINSDVGFDLAFTKFPKNKYKGAYIKIIDYTNADESAAEIFDESILIAHSKAYDNVKRKIEGRIIDNNKLIIFRELLSNAVFHKDYNSYAPIIVKIYQDRIEINNPCVTNKIDINYLNSFEMPTNPVNGCLTDIAMDMHIMEGEGRGEETFKKAEINEPYQLICNILKVTMEL